MILLVGLTGGIASGKSTIARTLAGLGCVVIDADRVVHGLYRRGAAGHHAIVEKYGTAVLAPNGEIDRQRLSDAALTTPEGAAELNATIHPLVRQEIAAIVQRESDRFPGRDRIVVVEVTLLFESQGRDGYDIVVVVDADPEQQEARGVRRGMSSEELRRRTARQMTREERTSRADYVVQNKGDARSAEVEAHRLYDYLARRLAEKKGSSQ
jgi:dephospho-CoA kinase